MTNNLTTELREKLTECGVKWWDAASHKTKWRSTVLDSVVAASEWNGNMVLDTGYTHVTPEQAIAATLGSAPSADWGCVITGLIAAHYDNNEERFKERAVQAAKMYDKAGKYEVAEYIIAQYNPATAFIPM